MTHFLEPGMGLPITHRDHRLERDQLNIVIRKEQPVGYDLPRQGTSFVLTVRYVGKSRIE